MGALRNQRHETFCQGVAKGLSQAEAFRRAGYSPAGASGHASRLVSTGSVRARIQELRAQAARRNRIDVDSLTAMLQEIHEKAVELRQMGAAISAIWQIAKLHGLATQKAEVKVSVLDDLDDGERESLIAVLRAELERRGTA
jgi:phage terminase small subunit